MLLAIGLSVFEIVRRCLGFGRNGEWQWIGQAIRYSLVCTGFSVLAIMVLLGLSMVLAWIDVL